MAACKDAGIADAEAARVVADESEALPETEAAMRDQAGNGVDSVPFVLLEGRRRDLSLQGAKAVEDYVKALQQIVKESV